MADGHAAVPVPNVDWRQFAIQQHAKTLTQSVNFIERPEREVLTADMETHEEKITV